MQLSSTNLQKHFPRQTIEKIIEISVSFTLKRFHKNSTYCDINLKNIYIYETFPASPEK